MQLLVLLVQLQFGVLYHALEITCSLPVAARLTLPPLPQACLCFDLHLFRLKVTRRQRVLQLNLLEVEGQPPLCLFLCAFRDLLSLLLLLDNNEFREADFRNRIPSTTRPVCELLAPRVILRYKRGLHGRLLLLRQ